MAMGVVLVMGQPASAVTIVSPTVLGGAEGNTSSRAPLHRDPLREQDLYASSEFPSGSPIVITEIRYRRDTTFSADHSDAYTATFNEGDIEIRMSTTTKADDGLSTIFADNIGGDELLVHDGPITINSTDTSSLNPKPFDIIIPLETPFTYDPSQGNLLVDFKILNDLGLTGIEHDTHDVGADGVSRVLFIGPPIGAASDPNAPEANLVQTAGIVTEFVFGPVAELGDFNFDTIVDTVDFGILRDHLGAHLDGPVAYENGDIDTDGEIDLDDFGQFKALFPGVAAQTASVPEPSSLALALCALVPLAALVRRRSPSTPH
jgi:hypothetical protein